MRFVIQTDNELDIERTILQDLLNKNKYAHDYFRLTLQDLKELNLKYSENEIPIGTIEFVTLYLNKVNGLKKENPIEIPKYMRTPEFLKREYNIVTWDKIPRYGRYFIKDASTLKHFSYNGNLEYFIQEEMFEEAKETFDTSLRLSKDAYYVISEEVQIISEYRVYVIDNEITAISNYDGDCTVFPDIDLLKKVVKLVKDNEEYLKSYTIDTMVTNRGTSIIEIHNFTSVGLYTSCFGNELLTAYKQGIEYLLKDNKIIQI